MFMDAEWEDPTDYDLRARHVSGSFEKVHACRANQVLYRRSRRIIAG